MARRAAETHDQTARELSVIKLTLIIHDVRPAFMHHIILEPVGEDSQSYFRSLHSRTLNTLNKTYLLPVDQDEVQVSSHNVLSISCVYFCPALRYSSPVTTIRLFRQKLCRSSKRGSPVWPAPQRQVFSATANLFVLISNIVLDLGTGSGAW